MRLRPDQLPSYLQKHGLKPVYLISGDEPLQVLEASDGVRRCAREQGIAERVVLEVDPGFDWAALAYHGDSLSLFATRRLIELRLGERKPGPEGERALHAFCERQAKSDVFLVTMSKLDARAQQAAWFKAIEARGIIVQAWPVPPRDLPHWITRRLAAKGVQVTQDAAELIAQRVEGNLLAASQELETLVLSVNDKRIGVQEAMAVVSDCGRYNVFELADNAVAGNPKRSLRILHGLRDEGAEPLLVNWALARELRLLCRLRAAIAKGSSPDQLVQENQLRRHKIPGLKQALRRHSLPGLRGLLLKAGDTERVIKGASAGDPWVEITWLVVGLAGSGIPQTRLRDGRV